MIVFKQDEDRTMRLMFLQNLVWGSSPEGIRAALVALTAMALVAAPSPAKSFDTRKLNEGGSLTLDEIMPLIDKSQRLKREVDAALKKAGKKREDIACGGMRFSAEWDYLAGERVAPYYCHFAAHRVLEITATVEIRSSSGKVFRGVTRQTKKQASSIRETHLSWKWLKSDPRDPPRHR